MVAIFSCKAVDLILAIDQIIGLIRKSLSSLYSVVWFEKRVADIKFMGTDRTGRRASAVFLFSGGFSGCTQTELKGLSRKKEK